MKLAAAILLFLLGAILFALGGCSVGPQPDSSLATHHSPLALNPPLGGSAPRAIFSAESLAQPDIVLPPQATITPLPPAVDLSWDAVTDGTVAIYYGTFSHSYTQRINAGTNRNLSIPGLDSGRKYYFSATHVDDFGVESDFAPELALTALRFFALHFDIAGTRLEASTNLVDWQPRSAQLQGETWRVAMNPAVRQEFYRAVQ